MGECEWVDVTEGLQTTMQQMLDGTVTGRLGKGLDYSHTSRKLAVVKVQRIENTVLWEKYLAERKEMLSHHKALVDKGHAAQKVDVATSAALPGEFLQELNDELNEVYLCHGTTAGVEKIIAHSGFEERLAGSGTGTMYGFGTYFGENSCKVRISLFGILAYC